MSIIPLEELAQRVHSLNQLLNTGPFEIIAGGVFWYFLLLFSCPILAFGVLFYTGYKLLVFQFWNNDIDPKSISDKELAVVVTGCDSGFGKELAFSLMTKGFVVFAGCLKTESFEQFKGEPKIIPIQIDVTNDKHIEDAYTTVKAWLEDESSKERKRCLHALVNNAGIGPIGLADWMTVSDFQRVMDVNFFGTLRCVKAFLPILKHQAANDTYKEGRIVNMSSLAGIFAGGVISNAYESSKHALDAFTTNLRLEMKSFGIKVTSINPGMHKTSLANGQSMAKDLKKVWDAMSPEHREEYGDEYFKTLHGIFENNSGTFHWDMKHVVEAMDQVVVSQSPPARVLVGLDAKYLLYPLSKLPAGCGVSIIRSTPAIMAKN